MKVYHVKTGAPEHREAIDAREMVATGDYSYTDPNAPANAPPEKTAGEVLADSADKQHKENMRSQYQQFADATEVGDHLKMEEANPVLRARKRAIDARKAADEAARLAVAGGQPPVHIAATPASIAMLKSNAEQAEKNAKDLEAKAEKMAKDASAADEALKEQTAREEAETEKLAAARKAGKGTKGAGKGTKGEGEAGGEVEEDLEELSKSDLQARCDKEGVTYAKSDSKADLIDKLNAATADPETLTKEQLQARLDTAGISYAAGDVKADLIAKLPKK